MPDVFNKPGQGENDISDLRATTPAYAEISPTQLPIRGEKRIIPSFVDVSDTNDQVTAGIRSNGSNADPNSNIGVETNDFLITAAMKPFVDYIVVLIPHRGTTNGVADPSQSAAFRFIINPATVQVNRTMVDAQSMTRAGWQFGVWGEDTVSISLSGQTAGQYFSLGTTDAFQSFTKSYRNLAQLVMVFENNGYWFEGEQAGNGPLNAADFTRRRIKMHQDVVLVVGNFIWYGMFDQMTVSQDAEKPFLANFTINFTAWKERFRNSSPYIDNVHNDVARGQTYGQYPTPPPQTPNAPPQFNPTPLPPATSPAVESFELAQTFPTEDTAAQDFQPMFDVFNPSNPRSIFGKV